MTAARALWLAAAIGWRAGIVALAVVAGVQAGRAGVWAVAGGILLGVAGALERERVAGARRRAAVLAALDAGRRVAAQAANDPSHPTRFDVLQRTAAARAALPLLDRAIRETKGWRPPPPSSRQRRVDGAESARV